MTLRQQIAQFFISMLLLTALMLPTVVKFAHVFEDHKHISCTEKSTNIHQTEAECHICDFHLATFDYKSTEYLEILNSEVFSKVEKQLAPLLIYSLKKSSKQLRAPPYFIV